MLDGQSGTVFALIRLESTDFRTVQPRGTGSAPPPPTRTGSEGRPHMCSQRGQQ